MKRIWQSATVLVMLAVAGAAAVAETGINTDVTAMESRYSVRHHGVPGLWLAKPFLICPGSGGLKIAEFGNLRLPPEDAYGLKHSVEEALGSEWSPFVETWSKNDGEWTLIFSKADGGGFKMLIVSSEPDDALTLLQVNVSGRAVRLWLDEPSQCAKRLSGIRTGKTTKDTETRETAPHGPDLSQSSLPITPPQEP